MVMDIAILLLGLIVGSFINVVVIRLPRGESLMLPGSHCRSCGKKLKWWENIPVLGWLMIRGKCTQCAASVSIRYPLIEFLTMVLFYAVYLRLGKSLGLDLWLRALPFVSILVAVTFIDLEHRIIPDVLSLGGMALGLLTSFLDPVLPWWECWVGGVLGFSVFFFFAWAYERLTGRMGLGGGDIKFLGMLGAFLGIHGVFTTLLLSSVLGAGVGVIWGLVSRKEPLMKVSIPYGPFLVLGALVHYFFGDHLWLRSMIPM